MATPLTCSPNAPPRRLLQAAGDGNLPVFKAIANAMDVGRGRLRETVEAVRDCGAGALHLAAGRGGIWVCRYLVEELRVDVNTVDESGDTPLAYAVRGGGVDTVRYLLDHDANPDKPNKKGCTPLHLAAAQGNFEMVEALILRGADVDSLCVVTTQAQLHQSIYCRLMEGTMKDLWNHLSDCNNNLINIVRTPLAMAVDVGSLECVELLIKAGANVKGVGSAAPLIIAAINGLTDFYKCLLEAGADPDVRDDFGHLPLEIAALNNRWKDVEILIQVTSPVPYIHDWSIDGVISYTKSVPAAMEDYVIYMLNPFNLNIAGGMAYVREEYVTAVKCFSTAILHFPDEVALYSNRILCWLKMGKGEQALRDAQICRSIHPDWAKACFLQGTALMLLKVYGEACDAFLDALKLDPADAEIQDGLREAINCLKEAAARAGQSSEPSVYPPWQQRCSV